MSFALYQVDGAVATLTLNRPERLNAFDDRLVNEAMAHLAAAKADPAVKALILTGAGRGFCAGADLTALNPTPETVNAAMRDLFNPLILAIRAIGKPTVAAINGVAAGAGVGVALACDIAVAARSAGFVLTFGPMLGLVPDLGCTWFLPRAIGRARAMGMALLGDRIDAETARDWGMVWSVVDDNRCLDEAQAIASRLAQGSAEAFTEIGALIDAAATNDLGRQLDLEREAQARMIGRPAFRAGVLAFFARKKG